PIRRRRARPGPRHWSGLEKKATDRLRGCSKTLRQGTRKAQEKQGQPRIGSLEWAQKGPLKKSRGCSGKSRESSGRPQKNTDKHGFDTDDPGLSFLSVFFCVYLWRYSTPRIGAQKGPLGNRAYAPGNRERVVEGHRKTRTNTDLIPMIRACRSL